jgi:hypothetical protein
VIVPIGLLLFVVDAPPAGSQDLAARKIPVTHPEPPTKIHEAEPDPRPPAVTFVSAEHFVLQGARSSTIAESSGRANMFLAAVSGGLVALGLVATASSVGTAF